MRTLALLTILLLGSGFVPRASHAQPQKPLPLSLPDTTVAADRVGQTITIPVMLDTTVFEAEGIRALEVAITGDPSVIAFTGAVQAGTLTADWPLFVANADGGRITVAAAATGGAAMAGGPAPVALLRAEIVGEGASPLTVTRLQLNEGDPAAAAEGGTVTVGEDELPVEFGGAPRVHLDGTAAVLRWTTLSETNNAGFQVQHRRPEHISFADVPDGFVPSQAPGGTAVRALRYRFRIEQVQPGRHVFRVRQVDVDGGVAYSPAVELVVPAHADLSEPYPNPFAGATQLDLTVPERQQVQAEMYDVRGRRVQDVWSGPVAGTKTLRVEGAGLTSGTYLVRVAGETFQRVRRLTLVR